MKYGRRSDAGTVGPMLIIGAIIRPSCRLAAISTVIQARTKRPNSSIPKCRASNKFMAKFAPLTMAWSNRARLSWAWLLSQLVTVANPRISVSTAWFDADSASERLGAGCRLESTRLAADRRCQGRRQVLQCLLATN